MESRKIALRETLTVAVGEAIGVGIMIGIFALLGKLDGKVLFGGIVGGVLAVGYFFSLAVVATLAADKAQAQDVAAGQKLLRAAYPLRMLALAALLFVFASSGYCNVLALVLPLAFVRPTITLAEFFRKKEA